MIICHWQLRQCPENPKNSTGLIFMGLSEWILTNLLQHKNFFVTLLFISLSCAILSPSALPVYNNWLWVELQLLLLGVLGEAVGWGCGCSYCSNFGCSSCLFCDAIYIAGSCTVLLSGMTDGHQYAARVQENSSFKTTLSQHNHTQPLHLL